MISVTLLGTPLDAAIEPTVSAIVARRFRCYREERVLGGLSCHVTIVASG